MTLAISVELNDARNAAIQPYLDTGAGFVTLQIFGSTRPDLGAESDSPPLVELTLPKPCGEVVTHEFHFFAGDDGLIATSGIAVWGRLLNGAGVPTLDGDVSDAAGTGTFKIPSTQLYAGGATKLVSGVLR